MSSKAIWLSILAVILSFIGGFILANALNRQEMDGLRAENARLKDGAEQDAAESSLSLEEIKNKIVEADQNQNDFDYQKKLGLALYRYAAMKKDAGMLADVERILLRAAALNGKDYDVAVALGHLNFDIGFFQKDNQRFEKARDFYQKILIEKPNDFVVRTEYGLTYFLQDPPAAEKAIVEFEKSLRENPRHERALQYLIQALLREGKISEAEIALSKLKAINPKTPNLAEIQTQLDDDKNSPN